jgi:CheY-like chemotaxis protein
MTSSIEALDTFQQNPNDFDLIVTDLTMPNMTGLAFSQRIHALRAEIPIIVCTGFGELLNKDQAKAIGICDFIMKPIIGKDLAKTIRNALDNSI